MAKKKYPPPAKMKYDKSHPIVSIRVSPGLKKKLEDIQLMSDRSPADILKKTVGLQIHSTSDPYTKGYLMAQLHYCVSYECSVCGKRIVISTPDEKKALGQYMTDHGWKHAQCVKK
jgi:hypothetical protein